jgi:hypothetical protein
MNAWKYVASIKVISDEKIISGSDNEIKNCKQLILDMPTFL